MIHCPHCNQKQTFWQTYKAFYKMKHWHIICPHCNQEITLTYKDQDKVMFLRIPILLLVLLLLPDNKLYFTIVFLYTLFIPLLYPYLLADTFKNHSS
ncbi:MULTISPECIES: TIGR04104 family putative zinc finger protein [unclassified Jeotgalibaca]|uniref:TIGR04104 family putative zinc finger protein n=1 Tax=unclassified Jeotgalibaca TaxID=2621505 RepID=UPI003FD22D9F